MQRAQWLHLARLSRKLLTVHHILLQGESHCEQDHGSRPCLCFLLWCLNSTSDDRRAGVGKRWACVEMLNGVHRRGLDISSYSTERVGMRKPPKQPICPCPDSSQILSFELISNYSACIVQINTTKIPEDRYLSVSLWIVQTKINSDGTSVLA